MDYYIRDKQQPDGPHDMMALIRKIRNGALSEHTFISKGLDGEMKAAGQWPELMEFFASADTDDVVVSRHAHAKTQKSFPDILAQNIQFLRNHPIIAVYSGVFVVAWLIIAAVFFANGNIISNLIGTALCYFLLGGYFHGIRRFVHGNPLRVGDVLGTIGATAVPMILASLIFAFLMLPALILHHYVIPDDMAAVSLPILFILLFTVMTFFAFVPLLIVQKRRKFLEAIFDSYRAVMHNKAENIGIVFALTTLNFIFLPFLPVVLPVTSTALAELYEEIYG
ncbi:MAG: DUF4339 domain-containing protein [Alphaproteobacteria bacterium]|nr:DUF4339 domain-containing protein [Alphaproteobacteria bacterium]